MILYQNNQKQSVYTITLQIAKNTIVLDFGNNVLFRNHRNYDNSKFINKY